MRFEAFLTAVRQMAGATCNHSLLRRSQLLALREKYGKNEFYNHLDEVFDEDTLHDMIYGSEVISFDLDNEYYMYSFAYHQITDRVRDLAK